MYFAALPICFLVATGWKKPHPKRSNFFNIASMTQSAFDKIDKDCDDAYKEYRRLLKEHRARMEDLVKDLTPTESFDMREKQLFMEHPEWFTRGREDCRKNFYSSHTAYAIYYDDCDDGGYILDRLKDPRYSLSCTTDYKDCVTHGKETLKCHTEIILQLAEDEEE